MATPKGYIDWLFENRPYSPRNLSFESTKSYALSGRIRLMVALNERRCYERNRARLNRNDPNVASDSSLSPGVIS
jgi:hypothetical protein